MKTALFLYYLFSAILSPAQANPAPSTSEHPPLINLNTANVQILSKSIKGIGLKRAESIVKYRDAHKGFKSLEELSFVPLIGRNFVATHWKEIEGRFTVK